MVNNDVFSTLQNTEATIFYLDSDYYPGQVPAQDVAGVQELIASCIKHLNKLQQKVSADAINTNSARRMYPRKPIRTNASVEDATHAYTKPIFGFLLHSDMTGMNVMFCSEDDDHLERLMPEILDMVESEDSYDWDEYAHENGILVADDEGGPVALYHETDDAEHWIVETNRDTYEVDVIGRDHFRF
jgi:hypothetical protein